MIERLLVLCSVATGCLTACVDHDFVAYDCSVFTPAEASPYILPWAIGTTHVVLPHAARETSPQKYALDVPMPIGTEILAIRSGVVVRVVESFVDGDNVYLHENHVIVE